MSVVKHTGDYKSLRDDILIRNLLEITTSNLKAEKHRSVDEYHTV